VDDCDGIKGREMSPQAFGSCCPWYRQTELLCCSFVVVMAARLGTYKFLFLCLVNPSRIVRHFFVLLWLELKAYTLAIPSAVSFFRIFWRSCLANSLPGS
jgi:hypothetical protein